MNHDHKHFSFHYQEIQLARAAPYSIRAEDNSIYERKSHKEKAIKKNKQQSYMYSKLGATASDTS